MQLPTRHPEFIDLDVARAYGVLLIRNFFLAHPAPRLEVLSGAVLRITCWLTTWGSRLERCRLGSACATRTSCDFFQ